MALYNRPHEFEPLLPERRRAELRGKAAEVVRRSLSLTGSLHPTTLDLIADLLVRMNSYYSNRIEGQGTHPLDIERALRRDFVDDRDRARLQRLALAHIEAERALIDSPVGPPLSVTTLQRAHREIYERLPNDERQGIEPGAIRTQRVTAGRHVPPEPESIRAFHQRFEQFYVADRSFEDHLLATAAAHHRALWIHPFADGNGRAVRLQTQLSLRDISASLWSVTRGFARRQADYYASLDRADSPRQGALDGRGFLSDSGLAEWCDWFLEVCLDQVNFMSSMLQLDGLRVRYASMIAARAVADSRYRAETAEPLFYVAATGPMPRGQFIRSTGLGERTGRAALAHLIHGGLLVSETSRRPVRVAFPLDSLQLLFPGLYPEAATSPGRP